MRQSVPAGTSHHIDGARRSLFMNIIAAGLSVSRPEGLITLDGLGRVPHCS